MDYNSEIITLMIKNSKRPLVTLEVCLQAAWFNFLWPVGLFSDDTSFPNASGSYSFYPLGGLQRWGWSQS